MTRIVALQASIVFVALTVFVAAMSPGLDAAVLTALVAIGGAMAAMLAIFAAAPAQPAPIPVRARSRRIAR